jgi:capsular polysaccharide biosynthesis protein
MEETISLKELLASLKKRMSLVLLLVIIAVTVSGVVSFYFLTPLYQSSTQILVNQSKNSQQAYSSMEVQTNLQLINTYTVIIKSPAILDLVIRELNLDLTAKQLNSMITVASEKDSQVVNITVEDTDSKMAAEIANMTANVFQQEISNIMKVDNVSILAMADENSVPVEPRPLLNMAIALVVSLIAGIGLAFLLEYFDNTIKSEKDVESILGLPVLGVIPIIDDSEMEKVKAKRTAKKPETRGETVGF